MGATAGVAQAESVRLAAQADLIVSGDAHLLDLKSFKGIEIEMTMTLGPPAPGMAAVGIQGKVPAYPKAAADVGQGGLVMLRAFVDVDGSVREVSVDGAASTVAADSDFARNSVAAAAQWKFQPAVKDGKPVPGWVMVPVRFEPPTNRKAGDES